MRPSNDPKSKQSPAIGQDFIGDEELDDETGNRFLFFNVMPSWMVSFLTHLAIIILLAIIIMPDRQERKVALEAGEQAVAPVDSIDLNLDALDFESEDPFETEISEELPNETAEELEDVRLPEAVTDLGNIMGAEEMNLDADIGELSSSDTSNETTSRNGEVPATLTLDAFRAMRPSTEIHPAVGLSKEGKAEETRKVGRPARGPAPRRSPR